MTKQAEKAARGSVGSESPRIMKACKKRKFAHVAIFAVCVLSLASVRRGRDVAENDDRRNMALTESLPTSLDFEASSPDNTTASIISTLEESPDSTTASGIVSSLKEPSLPPLPPGPPPLKQAKSEKHKKQIVLSRNISIDNPLFVLSFANHGNLALSRYFRCAGLNASEVGRTWTKSGPGRPRELLGACMDTNLHSRNKTIVNARTRLGVKAILNTCGDFQIWSEMEYVSHRMHNNPNGKRECLFPVLRPGVLEKLFQAYPQATVLNVVRNPDEWYQTLSPQEKQRWPRWCNANHGNAFPQANASKQEWLAFYRKYQRTLREAVALHPTVKYVEVDLDGKSPEDTGLLLQEQLGLAPPSCWTEEAVKPGLPRQLTFPIFVPSLPKSATSTSHSYLNCGLGRFEGSHQWTAHEDTGKRVTVGKCWLENMRNNRPVLDNCGDQKHWSDFGVEDSKGTCFYPTIHDDGLEAIYKDYPYATILHTTRDAKNWYKSALKWNTVLERWSRCDGFPKAAATDEAAWTQFYEWHTTRVREFARSHPTMTYVEVQIEDDVNLQNRLADNFGFPKHCWGHRNVNKNKD